MDHSGYTGCHPTLFLTSVLGLRLANGVCLTLSSGGSSGGPATFFARDCYFFFNSKHMLKSLDFLYFVVT